MLIPIQASGRKVPLFFVHGIQGLMPLGSVFGRALGTDQPLFAIHADGGDGRRPVVDNMADVVRLYVEQIESVRPRGPVRVGGMCTGSLVAVEIARSLQNKGRETGPVILADPPPMPSSGTTRRTADHRQPQVARQLYEQARLAVLRHAELPYNAVPFDSADPEQVRAATQAAVAALIAASTHVPTPFSGPAELILSAERAPAFFHPQMPWSGLLSGRRAVHVLPWGHMELFREGREALARLLRFLLEDPATLQAEPGRRTEPMHAAGD